MLSRVFSVTGLQARRTTPRTTPCTTHHTALRPLVVPTAPSLALRHPQPWGKQMKLLQPKLILRMRGFVCLRSYCGDQQGELWGNNVEALPYCLPHLLLSGQCLAGESTPWPCISLCHFIPGDGTCFFLDSCIPSCFTFQAITVGIKKSLYFNPFINKYIIHS